MKPLVAGDELPGHLTLALVRLGLCGVIIRKCFTPLSAQERFLRVSTEEQRSWDPQTRSRPRSCSRCCSRTRGMLLSFCCCAHFAESGGAERLRAGVYWPENKLLAPHGNHRRVRTLPIG